MKNERFKNFGKKVKGLRIKNNLTLEELANKIDSAKSYVWDIENKPYTRPSFELVQNLSIALKTTMNYLAGEKEPDWYDKVFIREFKMLNQKKKEKLFKIMEILR